MATFRVVQTVEAFKYPVGKVWGPYLTRVDAEAACGYAGTCACARAEAGCDVR